MKKTYFILLILIFVIAGCGVNKYKEDGIYAEMNTAKGLIVLKLNFKKTPMTVANFVGLSEGTIKNSYRKEGEPFYDGLTFHRVVDGFVIQGGDPNGNGSGNPGYSFPDEFDPELKHDSAGILSMANAGPGTNGSQFFITLAPTPHLDGKHSVFGKVIKGMDVVNKIEQGDLIKSVKIVRVGKDADVFIAADVFGKLMKKSSLESEEKMEQKKKNDLKVIDEKWPKRITTSTGLMYVVLKEGKGGKPVQGQLISAHYTGMFLDGKKFDSSVDRGQPLEFPVGVGKVIKGWDQALLDMKKGEKRILIIPPDLAYGEKGIGPIPPGSTLVFEVELVDIK